MSQILPGYGPGPFCTLQLAHLGAEVIRIESESRLCITRRIPPVADGEAGHNRCGYFNQYNQGKHSICLNLKKPQGLEVAKKLVAASDIVAENFAVGVMDKMGLGYDTLKAIKSDIIMIALSGYGATGPESPYVSYGPAQVPMSGLASMTGFPDSRPMSVGFSYGDPNGGLHGAFAVLAALMHRARTGEGQYIDLSQWGDLARSCGGGDHGPGNERGRAAADRQSRSLYGSARSVPLSGRRSLGQYCCGR